MRTSCPIARPMSRVRRNRKRLQSRAWHQKTLSRLEIEGRKRQILQKLDENIDLKLPNPAETDAQPLPQGGQAGDHRRQVHGNPHLRRSRGVARSRHESSRTQVSVYPLRTPGFHLARVPSPLTTLVHRQGRFPDDQLAGGHQSNSGSRTSTQKVDRLLQCDGTDGAGERARGIGWTQTLIQETIRRWAP